MYRLKTVFTVLFVFAAILLQINSQTSSKSPNSSPLTNENVTLADNSDNSTTTSAKPLPTTTTTPFRRVVGRAGAENCAANGTSQAIFEACGYTISNKPGFFTFETCSAVDTLSPCQPGEFGYGNCQLCIKAGNVDPAKPISGHLEMVSEPIAKTAPQCQVRVRVSSEGSADIGNWKVLTRSPKQPNVLVASLVGSYQGEMELVGRVGALSDFSLVIQAEQWSNFTGRKALGSIAWEFCSVNKTPADNSLDFVCNSGERLSWAAVCDFVADCADGSDEKPEVAGCGHRTEHCMFPKSCSVNNGWSPIDGRIIPRILQADELADGFLPTTPDLAKDVIMPGITDQPGYSNGSPLVIDLTSKMLQTDDSFVFNLPEIDAIRDLNDDVTQCWLRFHYFIPPGLPVEFSVLDAASKSTSFFVHNLEAVSSFGWVREQIELKLFSHHLSANASKLLAEQESRVEFYKPQIRIRAKQADSSKPVEMGQNGVAGLWGLSFSHGCRPVHTYCPSNLPDRTAVGCRDKELSCKSKFPKDPLAIIETMLTPGKDGSPSKDFCYPPHRKCNFVCDCEDCSDEAECGGSCDFRYPETCGWLTGDNWLWPPERKSQLCNGQSCILTVPEKIFEHIHSERLLSSRALFSSLFEWMTPDACKMTFEYRLWPNTALSFVHWAQDGDMQWLFNDYFNDTDSVTSWKVGEIDFSKFAAAKKNPALFSKFRLAFLPESLQQADPVHQKHLIMGNEPVGLAKVKFSPECGKPSPNDTSSCPLKAATCLMKTDAGLCVAQLEQPLVRACGATLVSCNPSSTSSGLVPTQSGRNASCTWKQPSHENASQVAITTAELFKFSADERYCNRGSCYAIVQYDVLNITQPSAYLAMVLEERGLKGSFKQADKIVRRQRLWQVMGDTHPDLGAMKYVSRIPINYCPTDMTPDTKQREVSVQFEGTSGSADLVIGIVSVLLTESCFENAPIESLGFQITCNDSQIRCRADKRCYPRKFLCGQYAKRALLGDMCPGEHDDSHGFDFDEKDCMSHEAKPASTQSNDDDTGGNWSGARVLGITVAVLASLILVVLVSYLATKRAIQWYRSGGGHRSQISRDSDSHGSSGPRSDGHHFNRLIGQDNSTQMMLDMLMNDEDV